MDTPVVAVAPAAAAAATEDISLAEDAFGEVALPVGVTWGAHTERARGHFAIGTIRMPEELIEALIVIKGAAAAVNGRLGELDGERAAAIDAAAQALLQPAARGEWPQHFPLSPWQSGSGTQSHMNVNEVLAHLASRRLPAGTVVHPHDHVNRGQSSNDVVPSAMHLAALKAVQTRLLPALDRLAESLAAKAAQYGDVIKLGRTHLQDAVPLRLSQEIGAWRSQLLAGRAATERALPGLRRLAIGATAVGTGLNAHPDFAAALCTELSTRAATELAPADDPFAALAGHEPLLLLHGALRTLATALVKMANDVRLLASGPHGGIGELVLPANEPGTSIMPAKVNPTQCEALVMVCCQIFGNDVAVCAGAAGGQLQLNTCKPLIIVNVLGSIALLSDGMASFERHAVRGLKADRARIEALLERTLMLVAALAPHVGYDRAAQIALRAQQDGSTLREAALSLGVRGDDYDRWVNPQRMV